MAAAPVPATERTAASRPWAGLDPVEPFPRTHLRVSPTTPDGQGVGTLCAVERVPRALTDAPVAPLSDLARLVVDLLQQRLPAAGDGLAGAMSRRARMSAAGQELALPPQRWSTSTWIASRRYAAGDAVLRVVARPCAEAPEPADPQGRLGGEDLAVLLPGADQAQASRAARWRTPLS